MIIIYWDREEREIPTCPHCGYKGYGHNHTKRWYKTNWKVNPERLNIKPEDVENPYNSNYPIELYPECQVREQHKLHPELAIKPRTEKQKEATRKLVELNKKRRAKKKRAEIERLEGTNRSIKEKRPTAEEEASEKRRKRARARREKKYKSTNDTKLDQYMK